MIPLGRTINFRGIPKDRAAPEGFWGWHRPGEIDNEARKL